jgi:Domain of unknown function (DUF4870)
MQAPPPGPYDPYVLAPPPPAGPPRRLASRAGDALIAGAAHAAIIFGFFGVGFLLSLAINAGIWLYGKRSPYVAYHAQQAGCYQLFVLAFNVAFLFMVILLFLFNGLYPQWTFVGQIAGLLAVAGVIWFVASILYGLWGAVRVLLGKPFAYPVFGRLARKP